LSFTGGHVLDEIEKELDVRRARAIYCSVDAAFYRPMSAEPRWDLAYLGTYSADRQEKLDRFLLDAARALPEARFAVAGPLYPPAIAWPANVERFEHVAPPDHPAFYAAQRWGLNLTRADMVAAGWSPSVRLFEAAACGVALLSDRWPGLEEVFAPGEEILIVDELADVRRALREVGDEQRRRLGEAARRRVLLNHTSTARAAELESHLAEASEQRGHPRTRHALGGGG
jgi:spore maturation protein CgeB